MKQLFTIGGSVALKKALLEDTNISAYTDDSIKDFDYLAPYLDKYLGGETSKRTIHYTLPEQYNEAVEAVREFFKEDKWVSDKWYYAKEHSTEHLYKFSHFDSERIPVFSEVIAVRGEDAETYTNQKLFSNTLALMQPAINQQIQDMLSKAAVSKGLVEGAKVATVYKNTMVLCKSKYLYISEKDELLYNGCSIYMEGVWAEIIKEEPKKEGLVLKGVWLSTANVSVTLHLEPEHLQQIKEYLNK